MRNQLSGAAIVAALLVAGAASVRQDVRSVPGPGTGIVTVKGTVDIGALPDVRSVQAGDWKVNVANTPNVRVAATAPLDFIQQGRRYRITWPVGEVLEVVVREVATSGSLWIRVDGPDGRRQWINLALAKSVDEL